VKRLILLIALVVLVVILAGSSASAVPDTDSAIAGIDTIDNDATANQTEAIKSSSNATIAITMYAVDDESQSHTDTATVSLRARTAGGD